MSRWITPKAQLNQERTGGCTMDKLKELIEHERKVLNEVVKQGLDKSEVYEQSKKIDRAIEQYYAKQQMMD